MTNAKGFARFFIKWREKHSLHRGRDCRHTLQGSDASREIVDFEGENRQKVVDIAADTPDAAFFPRPDFRCDVVENGTGGIADFTIPSNFQ